MRELILRALQRQDCTLFTNMFANSRLVESSQKSAHPRLADVVRRHTATPYKRMPSDAGRRAFAGICERLAGAPFILDAGCGTGLSTLELASRFPHSLVLGVDKSAARLSVGQRMMAIGNAPANALMLQCELVDFWQLAATAGLHCERQYLLYPNPWPKPEHLKRRWHAHPVLPSILGLGGNIEVRTNWQVYAEEFALAMKLIGIEAECAEYAVAESLTPFEKKYLASGHTLWRVNASLKIAK
jgi:tRNA (guanine-N7-)-methyltransferase